MIKIHLKYEINSNQDSFDIMGENKNKLNLFPCNLRFHQLDS
jgi:hypothetical protein